MAGKIVVADFVCPTQETRTAFSPDFIIWLDTVTEGRYDDTNTLFEKPTYCQLTVDTWDYDINEIVKFIRQYESR